MRKGILKSLMVLLAGAGLTLTHPLEASAGGGVVRVAFEDADQKSMPSGEVIHAPHAISPTPAPGPISDSTIVEESGPSCMGGNCMGGDEELGGYEGGGRYGAGNRFFGSVEYLLWWVKGAHVPPLVTTGSADQGGVLGASSTSILIGNDTVNTGARSGARFTLGMWLDDCQNIGVEGNYWFLGRRTDTQTVTSDGTMLLARPFTDANTGAQNAELNALVNQLAATKTVTSSSFLQGAELNGICNFMSGCNYRVNLLAGFRYVDLKESLGINESIVVLPGITSTLGFPFQAGNGIQVNDAFSTRNQFYGGQVGARGEFCRGPIFVNFTGKVALGDMHQTVNINGNTIVTTPAGGVSVLQGGLLALSSNIGHYSRNKFCVIPEANLNVGYNISEHWRVFAGYSLMYISSVVRPGDQIDLVINPTLVPTHVPFGTAPTGPNRPSFSFHDTSLWVQGINFGIELRY